MLKRKTPMQRTAFKKKPPKVRPVKEGGDPAYLEWIRGLPCCMCESGPPCHPHHSTGAGMGLKSTDREAMPLCGPVFELWNRHMRPGCHRDFHDGKGRFDGWTRKERQLWQELQVERCQQLHARLFPEQLQNTLRASEPTRQVGDELDGNEAL